MAQGTGLPIPKSGLTVQAPNVIDADRWSLAKNWTEIAQAGAKAADAGFDYLEKAEHRRQVGYIAGQENDADEKRLQFELEHRRNPQGFKAAWDGYVKGKMEQAEPWAIEHLTKALGTRGNAAMRSLSFSKLAEDDRQDRERLDSNIKMKGNDYVGAAENGTLNAPAGRIAAQTLTATVNSAVSSGLWTKEKGDLVLDDYHTKAEGETAARAGIAMLGKGEPGAAEKAEAFLRDTVLKNEKLSPGGRERAYNFALASVRRAGTEIDRQDRVIAGEIKAVGRAVESGNIPPPEHLNELKLRIEASGRPEFKADYAEIESAAKLAESGRQMRPAELDARLATEKPLARDTGRKLLATMRKEIGTDPLGWADRVGLQAVPPIDFAAGNVPAQLSARRAQAEAIANYYGIETTYFRPDERVALEAAMLKGGPTMLSVAQSVSAGFGDAAPKAMAEISVQAPAMAHVGNLVAGSGSVTFAADFAEATKLRADKEFKIPRWLDKPTEKIRISQENRTHEVYGDAFFLARDTGRAANEAAQAVFFARAARGSKAYSPILEEDGASKKAYDKALQEAAGARFTADGTQYGGVGSYKTGFWSSASKVLVPENVRADRFRDAVTAITDADLAALPAPPRTAEGKAYTTADLRAAVPVASSGGYRFAMGDPASEDPKWIRGADGKPFVLDFARLEPELRKRAPGAFIGGR